MLHRCFPEFEIGEKEYSLKEGKLPSHYIHLPFLEPKVGVESNHEATMSTKI